MTIKHKQFFIKYKTSFFITKFLINNSSAPFILKFVRYNIDANKYSILNIYWVCFLLFGQVPFIKFYTKQLADKLIHSSLIITQNFTISLLFIYKLLNFFLLTSATENYYLKTKNALDSLRLKDNSYYPELSYFSRFFVNSFDINIFVAFDNSISLSLLEKVTIFRLLQLPVSLGFVQQQVNRRRSIYKKSKANRIK